MVTFLLYMFVVNFLIDQTIPRPKFLTKILYAGLS